MASVRQVSTDELMAREISALCALFEASWTDEGDEFTEEDFAHASGGQQFVIEAEGEILSHASVVERELHTGGLRLSTGYVEGVATLPAHRRRGFATAIMERVGDHVDRTFQLGALGSGLLAFYQRLGWFVWQGPTCLKRTIDFPIWRIMTLMGSLVCIFGPIVFCGSSWTVGRCESPSHQRSGR